MLRRLGCVFRTHRPSKQYAFYEARVLWSVCERCGCEMKRMPGSRWVAVSRSAPLRITGPAGQRSSRAGRGRR